MGIYIDPVPKTVHNSGVLNNSFWNKPQKLVDNRTQQTPKLQIVFINWQIKIIEPIQEANYGKDILRFQILSIE